MQKPTKIATQMQSILQTLSYPLGVQLTVPQISEKLSGGIFDEKFRVELARSAPSRLARDAQIVRLVEMYEGSQKCCLWEFATNVQRLASLEHEEKATQKTQFGLTERAKSELRTLRELLNPSEPKL